MDLFITLDTLNKHLSTASIFKQYTNYIPSNSSAGMLTNGQLLSSCLLILSALTMYIIHIPSGLFDTAIIMCL